MDFLLSFCWVELGSKYASRHYMVSKCTMKAFSSSAAPLSPVGNQAGSKQNCAAYPSTRSHGFAFAVKYDGRYDG